MTVAEFPPRKSNYLWRALFGVLLATTFLATSNLGLLATLAFYGRYLALGTLAAWTWVDGAAAAAPLASLSKRARHLVQTLWAVAIIALSSTIWSIDRTSTLLQAVALGLLAWLVHGLVTRRWNSPVRMSTDFGVAVMLLGGIFAAGVAAWAVGMASTTTYGGRFEGLFGNPNTLGMIATLVTPLSLGLWRSTGSRLFMLWGILAAISVLLSNSRTAAVALALGGIWALWRRGMQGRKGLVVPVALGLAGFVAWGLLGAEVPTPIQELIYRFSANQGGDLLNSRTYAWNRAIELLQEHPLEGYGYAAGPALFDAQREAGNLVFAADVVHNSYLQWLLELGSLGALAILPLLTVTLRLATQRTTDAVESALQWSVTAGLLIQLTESAMFGTGQPYPYIFWLAVAALAKFGTRSAAPVDL